MSWTKGWPSAEVLFSDVMALCVSKGSAAPTMCILRHDSEGWKRADSGCLVEDVLWWLDLRTPKADRVFDGDEIREDGTDERGFCQFRHLRTGKILVSVNSKAKFSPAPRGELAPENSELPMISARTARSIRRVGYDHLKKKLEGLEMSARSNTLSAHALYCDVLRSIDNEIEYPTI